MKHTFRIIALTVCILLGAAVWAQNPPQLTVTAHMGSNFASSSVKVAQITLGGTGTPTLSTFFDSSGNLNLGLPGGGTWQFTFCNTGNVCFNAGVQLLGISQDITTQLTAALSGGSGVVANSFGASASSAYTFTVSAGTVSAINNKTGVVDFSGTDAAAVVNSAMAAVASTCGTFYFKNGIYNLNSVTAESTGGYTNWNFSIGIPSRISANAYCEWNFIGESSPQSIGAFGEQDNGVIFNLTTTATGSVGATQVVAAWWVRPDPGAQAGPRVKWQNIDVRWPNNTRGYGYAINCWEAYDCERENVVADIAGNSTTHTVPSGSNIPFAAFTSTKSTRDLNQFKHEFVEGYYTCEEFDSEHIRYESSVCYQTVQSQVYGGTAAQLGAIPQSPGTIFDASFWNEITDFKTINGPILGANLKAGCQLYVYGLNTELTTSGIWSGTGQLSETNPGYCSGFITSTFVNATAGLSLVPPPTPFFSSGGANFQVYDSSAGASNVRTPVTDAFTDPTAGTLNPAWVNCTGTGCLAGVNLKISSNSAQCNSAGAQPCVAVYAGQIFTKDQFSLAAVNAITANDIVDVNVRGTQGVRTYYRYACSTSGGLIAKRRISLYNANVETILAQTTANSGCAAGDTIELDVIGSNLFAFYTPAASSTKSQTPDLVATDTTLTSGYPGIEIFDNTVVGAASLVQWQGGSLTPKSATDSIYNSPAIHPTYNTTTNCNVNTVSPAACGSSAAGVVVVPTTTTTYTVNSTAVTSLSRIFLIPITDATGVSGAPTCVAPPTGFIGIESARTAGTSFTFTLPSTTGTSCWNYWIVN